MIIQVSVVKIDTVLFLQILIPRVFSSAWGLLFWKYCNTNLFTLPVRDSLFFLCVLWAARCGLVKNVVSPPFLVAQRNMLWWWISKNCLEFVWSVPTAVTEPENSAAAPGIILRYALSILLDTYRAFFFFFWNIKNLFEWNFR